MSDGNEEQKLRELNFGFLDKADPLAAVGPEEASACRQEREILSGPVVSQWQCVDDLDRGAFADNPLADLEVSVPDPAVEIVLRLLEVI